MMGDGNIMAMATAGIPPPNGGKKAAAAFRIRNSNYCCTWQLSQSEVHTILYLESIVNGGKMLMSGENGGKQSVAIVWRSQVWRIRRGLY